jgi:hypothetical protein
MLVPDKCDPTCFYRASGIAHDLEKKTGHKIVTLQWNEIPVTWQVLSNFDILMLQRPFQKAAVELCQYAKSMSMPVWVDYDDNLFGVPPENKSFQTYNNPDIIQNIKDCLQAADVVSVPTEYLRQVYAPYNQDIHVIPNAFNDTMFRRGEQKPREKKAIWRGPDSHIYDLMSYGPSINQVTKEFPEWSFIFMGFYPWFLAETDNKGFLPGLDIIMYYKKMVDLNASICHVPLHDNPFNRCRSNIAYLEATYAGMVCVTPAWWNLPGAVPYSNPQEYYEAMKLCLSGEVDLEASNRMAWSYIEDCLTLSKVNAQRMILIEELL